MRFSYKWLTTMRSESGGGHGRVQGPRQFRQAYLQRLRLPAGCRSPPAPPPSPAPAAGKRPFPNIHSPALLFLQRNHRAVLLQGGGDDLAAGVAGDVVQPHAAGGSPTAGYMPRRGCLARAGPADTVYVVFILLRHVEVEDGVHRPRRCPGWPRPWPRTHGACPPGTGP